MQVPSPSQVGISVGTDAEAATYQVTELSSTKQIQRNTINHGDGAETFAGLAPVATSSAAATLTVRTGTSEVYGLYAINLSSVGGFLMLLDSASMPADGSVTPLAVAPISANGIATIGGALFKPIYCTNGVQLVLSSASTPFTKTTGAGLQGFISCQAR